MYQTCQDFKSLNNRKHIKLSFPISWMIIIIKELTLHLQHAHESD